MPEVFLLLLLDPEVSPVAVGRERSDRVIAVTAQVLRSATGLTLTAVLVPVGAIALFGCGACLRCARYRQPWKAERKVPWRRNPRFAKWWVWGAALVGGCTVALAVAAQCMALAFGGTGRSPGLLALQAGLAVAGGAMAVGVWAWALRDPLCYLCPVCHAGVSCWTVFGTYLPPLEGPEEARKAHTRHVLCVHCGKVVVQDPWEGGPSDRPYHAACWQAHVHAFLMDPGYRQQWLGAHGRSASDAELAHILAAAVHGGNEAVVEFMTGLRPGLSRVQLADCGERTGLHWAASCGQLNSLRLLLQEAETPLDPECTADGRVDCSLAITGLSEAENDVYLHHPLLTYNGRALYVGHAQGRYVYYYKPPPDRAPPLARGWRLSPHLGGGGESDVRLLLPDPDETDDDDDDETPAPLQRRASPTMTRRMSVAPVLTEDAMGLERVPHSTSLLQVPVPKGL